MGLLELDTMTEKELAQTIGALVYVDFKNRIEDLPPDWANGLYTITGLDADPAPAFFVLENQQTGAQAAIDFDELARIAIIVYPQKEP